MNKKVKFISCAVVILIVIGILAIPGIGKGVQAVQDADFQMQGSTLIAYNGKDTSVLIPSTVTEIGDQAFADNTTLGSVTFPDSVTKIGYRAFSGCSNLNLVEIPDSVTEIGPGAFYHCTGLKELEIGENVSSWGSGVLAGCTSLKQVDVDYDNQYLTYYSGALYNGDMTMLYQVFSGREKENYVMPDSVKTIDTYAFWECEYLKNISVGKGIKEIPTYAMTNMKTVENVVLPLSVTTISSKAFADNEALKQVSIPVSVSAIHDTAFDNCPNLKILSETNTEAEAYALSHNIPFIEHAELATEIKADTSEKLPDTQTQENKTQENKTQENTENQQNQSSGQSVQNANRENPLTTPENGDVVGKTIIQNGRAVVLMNNRNQKVYGQTREKMSEEEEEETETVTAQVNLEEKTSENDIPERAYYNKKQLTEYSFKNGVKRINKLAFAKSGLKSIDIPKSVETIGYGAFLGCEDLEDITIPDTVETIEAKAFSDTKWLTDWLQDANQNGDDFLIVGDGILLAYRGDTKDVLIPDTVKIIASDAFADHVELQTIEVPESVKHIETKAFSGCSALKGLKNCAGIEKVSAGAFQNSSLTEDNYLIKE